MSEIHIELRNAERDIEHILAAIERKWGVKVVRVSLENGVKIVTDVNK